MCSQRFPHSFLHFWASVPSHKFLRMVCWLAPSMSRSYKALLLFSLFSILSTFSWFPVREIWSSGLSITCNRKNCVSQQHLTCHLLEFHLSTWELCANWGWEWDNVHCLIFLFSKINEWPREVSFCERKTGL